MKCPKTLRLLPNLPCRASHILGPGRVKGIACMLPVVNPMNLAPRLVYCIRPLTVDVQVRVQPSHSRTIVATSVLYRQQDGDLRRWSRRAH